MSIGRCFYSYFVPLKKGYRRRFYIVLNVVQMITNSFFFVVLITRFMFPFRVCFCDFQASYLASMNAENVDIAQVKPSPEEGFGTCMIKRVTPIRIYLIVNGVIYLSLFFIVFSLWLIRSCREAADSNSSHPEW